MATDYWSRVDTMVIDDTIPLNITINKRCIPAADRWLAYKPYNQGGTVDNIKRQVMDKLKELCINTAEVSFDGSGDSGSIEDIQLGVEGHSTWLDYNTTRIFLDNNYIVSKEPAEVYNKDTHMFEVRETVTNTGLTLGQALKKIVEDWLDATGVDWYNNDGGYGTAYFNVDTGKIELEVYVRDMHSELAESENINVYEEAAA